MTNKIEVFDNEVPFVDMQSIYDYVRNSGYFLGWGDRDGTPPNIHTVYTKNEVILSELFKHLKNVSKKSELKFDIDNFSECVVNLSKCGDYNFNHTHKGKIVLLYYVNLEWKDGFAGETIFYDDSLINATSVISFVPGRIVIFDGETPHTIRPQSTYGPDYRFTISYFVNKN
tara:strand:+ start:40 stop:555 length:516 start_codon:yes stop_codon:yes gene_type:complete